MSCRRKSESGKVLRENHKLIYSIETALQTKNKAPLKSYFSSKVHKTQPHIFLHDFMNPGNATLFNQMERNHMVLNVGWEKKTTLP